MMFIDIESVPVVGDFDLLDERGQLLFCKKFDKELKELGYEPAPTEPTCPNLPKNTYRNMLFWRNAALHAEFGRVLCVSMGIKSDPKTKDDKPEFRIKSIADRDEKQVLLKVSDILLKETSLCGHNIKAFDLPFLFRRLIINSLPVPPCLQISGRKPWEIPHNDTLEMWACGDFNGKISLDRLAYALNLPSPKQEISGADVGPLWYSEGEKEELPFDRDERVLKIIKRYCAGDVLTQANCYFKIKGLPIIQYNEVTYVD